MKRSKLAVAVLTTLLATGFAFSAHAKGHKRHGDDGHEGRMESLIKELNVSADQKAKIKDLRNKNKEEMKKIREDIKELRAKMRTAWETDKPNRNKIMGIHKKIHNLKGQMGEMRIEFRLAVHKVLTPEQRKQAAKLLKERHEKRDGGECECDKGKRKGKKGRGHGPRF